MGNEAAGVAVILGVFLIAVVGMVVYNAEADTAKPITPVSTVCSSTTMYAAASTSALTQTQTLIGASTTMTTTVTTTVTSMSSVTASLLGCTTSTP